MQPDNSKFIDIVPLDQLVRSPEFGKYTGHVVKRPTSPEKAFEDVRKAERIGKLCIVIATTTEMLSHVHNSQEKPYYWSDDVIDYGGHPIHIKVYNPDKQP